ncbi:hypothetical protein BP6252_11469 [Coleophoma cylindrospora]|uniref:ARM repeat-containing protein n=1 Tax=Coleophoma cylindrospora TaxID=1849047 RepID=A0A3D8QJN5_9HELO|nr:hypothetical protein BP6252_11469 [Coleophoma cylindrospora]
MAPSITVSEYEKLNHNGRMKYMVEHGRKSKTSTSIQQDILQLSGQSLYEQLLAIQSCYGSGDVSTAIKLLSSSSSAILGNAAMKVIIRFGSDAEVLQSLNLLPVRTQMRNLQRMRNVKPSRRRQKAIDLFLDRIKGFETGDEAIYREVLPLGSEQIVRKHLPENLHVLTRTEWSRLAKYHPVFTRCIFDNWISTSRVSQTTIKDIFYLFYIWAQSDENVDLLISLIKTLNDKHSVELEEAPLQLALKRRPHEIMKIVMQSKMCPSLEYSAKFLQSLGVEELFGLGKADPHAIAQGQMYKLSLQQRQAVFESRSLLWRLSDGSISISTLRTLPEEQRVAEARRCVNLPDFKADPVKRMPYIALLPWDEAIKLQMPQIRSNDAAIRSSALRFQIESAIYDETKIGDALQLVLKNRNDQDPVRQEMTRGLAIIPAARWKTEHLADLDKIIRQALDVHDLSSTTLQNLIKVVTQILPRHTVWAVQQLRLIGKERNDIYSIPKFFNQTGLKPKKETMRELSDAMAPLLQTLIEKKQTSLLLSLRYAFAGFIVFWNEWMDAIEKVLAEEMEDLRKDRPGIRYGAEVLEILKTYRYEIYWNLIPKLVEKRSIMAKDSQVVHHVNIRRQNLLDSYLTPGDALYLEGTKSNPSCHHFFNFSHWTHTQQLLLASTSLNTINDPTAKVPIKLFYISRLSSLSFVDPKPLIELARSEIPIINETAMIALGQLDNDYGVAELLEALQDSRARIAIYALRKLFARMSRHSVLDSLKKTPMGKVTVAKEVVRLVGDLRYSEALEFLLTLEREDLHRDVRVSLVRALWCYLDHSSVWPIFFAAAQDSYVALAQVVVEIPQENLSEATEKHLLKAYLHLLQNPSAEIRQSILGHCVRNLRILDTSEILLARLEELTKSKMKTEKDLSAQAVFKIYGSSRPDLVAALFSRILHDYKALTSLFHIFTYQLSPNDKRMHKSTRLLYDLFSTDPLLVKLRLRLLFQGFPRVEPATEFRNLFHALVPDLQIDGLNQASAHLETLARTDLSIVNSLEGELGASSDEKARWLGVVCLASGIHDSSGNGWSEEKLDKLKSYQCDESLMVRGKAVFIFPPEKR